jgi:hypothetical protein
LDNRQFLEAICAPLNDFGLLNPLPVRRFDIQGELAPITVKVIRAKKGTPFEGYENESSIPELTLYKCQFFSTVWLRAVYQAQRKSAPDNAAAHWNVAT